MDSIPLHSSYGSIDVEERKSLLAGDEENIHDQSSRKDACHECLITALGQVPAIAVVALLWLMMALPFGVVYFPIGWSSDLSNPTDYSDNTAQDAVHGPFPLPGKESLGIRMCLFATLIGRLVMTFTSKFTNPIAFQLLENVPFCHSLAYTVIRDLGYGMDALTTLFFLFGLSSIIVGLIFFLLGWFKLGRVVYFFPSHVLVGCIGGIGIFICVTAVSVTNNEDVTFDMKGLQSFSSNIHLFGIVINFEVVLRFLMWIFQDQTARQGFLSWLLFTSAWWCLCSISPSSSSELTSTLQRMLDTCSLALEMIIIVSYRAMIARGRVCTLSRSMNTCWICFVS